MTLTQKEEPLEKQIRNLLEKHLLEWEQEGLGVGTYDLKKVFGYSDLQPFVDSIIALVAEEKEISYEIGLEEGIND